MLQSPIMKPFSSWIKKNPQLSTYLLPALAGLFVGTSYIPFPPWALLFCWTPFFFWFWKNQHSWKKVGTAAWLSSFILTMIGFYWISYVSYEFGHLPVAVAGFLTLLFAACAHLHIPLAALILWWIHQRMKLRGWFPQSLLTALIFSLSEYIWPSMYPWNLGYPLLAHAWNSAWVAQVIGFHGLSFFLFWIHALLACAALAKWNSSEKNISTKHFSSRSWLAPVGMAILLFLSLEFAGSYFRHQKTPTVGTLNILQVQPNIGNLERAMAEKGRGAQDYIVNTYIEKTREALAAHPDPQLILWPEVAIADYMNSAYWNGTRQRKLIDFFHEVNRPFLFGAFANEGNEIYNALFYWTPEKGLETYYKKMYLLAFGEYLPFAEYLPQFLRSELEKIVSSFGRGKEPMVHSTGLGKLGFQICYEGLFPEISRDLSQRGAQVIVNLTNDSWYGPTFETDQHAWMTLARAVEVQRPLIRSTNTGYTSVISADGKILQWSPRFQPWFGVTQVPLTDPSARNIFTRYGHLIPWIQWIALMALLLGYYRRGRT